VTSAEILISSGSALLDQAALDAVRRTAFTPATQDGFPVACRVIVPIRFQLSRAP
jgi:periplasmic protein TonB